MSNGLLPTLSFGSVAMLLLFRRAKRLFTRQRFSPPRLGLRLAVIGVACAGLFGVVSMARGPAPAAAGLAVGAAAGLIGLAYTRFERIEGAVYYTPNVYIGLAVMSLFLGRMLYRFTRIDEAMELSPSDPAAASLARLDALRGSPITAGVAFLLLGYFLCYTAALLARGWSLVRTPETDTGGFVDRRR